MDAFSLGLVALVATIVGVFTAGSVIVHKREAAAASATLEAYKLETAGKVADATTAGILAGEKAGHAQTDIDAANVELAKQKTLTANAALKAAEQIEKPVEIDFRLPDRWSRRLFTALCRRHGLTPYRYPRQRYSTVVLRAPASFINNVLWPEFVETKSALDEYLDAATERIIREEVFRVSEEAEERVS